MCPYLGKSFGVRAALHKEGSQLLIDLRFQSLANPDELRIVIDSLNFECMIFKCFIQHLK